MGTRGDFQYTDDSLEKLNIAFMILDWIRRESYVVGKKFTIRLIGRYRNMRQKYIGTIVLLQKYRDQVYTFPKPNIK